MFNRCLAEYKYPIRIWTSGGRYLNIIGLCVGSEPQKKKKERKRGLILLSTIPPSQVGSGRDALTPDSVVGSSSAR